MDVALILRAEDINKYLDLVDRRLKIMSSGVDWKPEYEQELQEINKSLDALRCIIDQAHALKDIKI